MNDPFETEVMLAELEAMRQSLDRLHRELGHLMGEYHRVNRQIDHQLAVKRNMHRRLDALYRSTKASRDAALLEVVRSLEPAYNPDYPEDHGFTPATAAAIRAALENLPPSNPSLMGDIQKGRGQ